MSSTVPRRGPIPGVLAVCLSLVALGGSALPATGLREEIEDLLSAGKAQDLPDLGNEALPIVFELMLEREMGPEAPPQEGVPTTSPRYEALREGLRLFPADAVIREVRRRAMFGAGPKACSLYLDLLQQFGRSTDLELAVTLCSALPEEQRADQVSALKSAVTSILERDPRGVHSLLRPLVHAPTDVARALASAAQASHSPFAAAMLAEVLGQKPELELTLLGLIARAADHTERPVAPGVCAAVRTYLERDDFQMKREAVHALGRLGDFESAGALIEMLGAEEKALRSTAHWSLRNMSRMEFSPESARWSLWLSTETEWFQARASATLERTQRLEVPTVLAALDELRRHRYRRFDIARQIEPLVEHRAEPVRERACLALQDLAPELAHPAHEHCKLDALADSEAAAQSGGNAPVR